MRRRNREISIFSMSALDLFASALGAFILLTIVIFPYFPNISPVVAAPEEPVPIPDPDLQRQLQELEGELAEAQRQLEAAQERLEEAGDEEAGDDSDALADLERELAELQGQLENAQERVAQAEEDAEEVEGLRERVAEAEGRYGDLWERYEGEVRRKFVMIAISWSTEDDVDLHVIDPQGNEYYYAAREHPGSPARFEEDTTQGPGNEFWLHPTVEPGVYEVYYNLYSHRDLEDIPSVRGVVAHSLERNDLPVTRLSVQGDRTLVARVAVDEDRNVAIER